MCGLAGVRGRRGQYIINVRGWKLKNFSEGVIYISGFSGWSGLRGVRWGLLWGGTGGCGTEGVGFFLWKSMWFGETGDWNSVRSWLLIVILNCDLIWSFTFLVAYTLGRNRLREPSRHNFKEIFWGSGSREEAHCGGWHEWMSWKWSGRRSDREVWSPRLKQNC